MNIFVRAVITGFGLSVGAALYKRVSKQLGLEGDDQPAVRVPVGDDDGSPGDVAQTIY